MDFNSTEQTIAWLRDRYQNGTLSIKPPYPFSAHGGFIFGTRRRELFCQRALDLARRVNTRACSESFIIRFTVSLRLLRLLIHSSRISAFSMVSFLETAFPSRLEPQWNP
jgi:hypothetical protein